jgi:hypothetical protein
VPAIVPESASKSAEKPGAETTQTAVTEVAQAAVVETNPKDSVKPASPKAGSVPMESAPVDEPKARPASTEAVNKSIPVATTTAATETIPAAEATIAATANSSDPPSVPAKDVTTASDTAQKNPELIAGDDSKIDVAAGKDIPGAATTATDAAVGEPHVKTAKDSAVVPADGAALAAETTSKASSGAATSSAAADVQAPASTGASKNDVKSAPDDSKNATNVIPTGGDASATTKTEVVVPPEGDVSAAGLEQKQAASEGKPLVVAALQQQADTSESSTPSSPVIGAADALANSKLTKAQKKRMKEKAAKLAKGGEIAHPNSSSNLNTLDPKVHDGFGSHSRFATA